MTCLEIIGYIIYGFTRLILFVTSTIFLLAALGVFLFNYESQQILEHAEASHFKTTFTILTAVSVYLVSVSLVGIIASFFTSENTLKLLAFLLALNVVVGISVVTFTRIDISSAQGELEKELAKYQTLYDWEHEKKNETDEVAQATTVWDMMQTSMHCCGLNSSDEWYKYAPKDHPFALPISCCVNQSPFKSALQGKQNDDDKYCDSKNKPTFKEGCSSRLSSAPLFKEFTVVLAAVVFFSLILGMITITVMIFSPKPREAFPIYGRSY